MTFRRNARRRHPEVVSAVVQSLELRRVLSAASLPISAPPAALSLPPSELLSGDRPPIHISEQDARLIAKRMFESAPVSGLLMAFDAPFATDGPAADRPTIDSGSSDPDGPDPVADVTDLKTADARRPQVSRRRSVPELNHPLPLAQTELRMYAEISGNVSSTGLDLLSMTLDRLPTVPVLPSGTSGIPVVPDRIDFPSVEIPANNGGLIDVTPMFQQERLGDDTDELRKALPADNEPQSDDGGLSRSAMLVPDVDSDIPFTQPATITHSLRHQPTATSDEGGYIDFVAFAMQTDSHQARDNHRSPRPQSQSLHQEIDAAVGRHRTFQIAESTDVTPATADVPGSSGAAYLPAAPAVRRVQSGSESHTAPKAMFSREASSTVSSSARHEVEALPPAAAPVDPDQITGTWLPPLPTNMLIPALGLVGALRSGVRQRLRRMVAGLVRKL